MGKDLIPDLTNFYNQYKSIEPWLKRKDGRNRAQLSTTSPKRTGSCWMVCTSASCAHAAKQRAHLTGGTLNTTWAQRCSSRLTAGLPTLVTTPRSALPGSTTQ